MFAFSERRPSLLDKFVQQMGYPQYLPAILTIVFVGLTFFFQMWITAPGGNFLTLGNGPLSTGLQVLAWLPSISFFVALALCVLRGDQLIPIGAALLVAVYGMTHGSETGGTPSYHWAWGVALALTCALLPVISKIAWWMLALLYIDKPVRVVQKKLVSFGSRQIARANHSAASV